MEYPKINSLWKRQGLYFDEKDKKDKYKQESRQSFIVGDYAQTEFASIKYWEVDEKIDGTNIRIFYEHGEVRFGGRTKDAQIPCHLLDYLQNTFKPCIMELAFPNDPDGRKPRVILFGEGYGPKIQACGGNYCDKVSFILFDVLVGEWWLKREDVHKVAESLSISSVPYLGLFTEEEVVKFVKSKPLSLCSKTPQVMEGVICRSSPLMLTRSGQPIMWKLKCKEFKDENK